MERHREILIAYDGSEGAKAAIEGAGELFADWSMLVLSVERSVAATASAAVIGMPAEVAGKAMVRLNEEVQRRVEALAEEGADAARSAGLEARHLGTLCDGSIWSEVLRVADERDVAAVMVGSRGLSDIKSILLGSVSSGVVHHSIRPVVVVRGATVRP